MVKSSRILTVLGVLSVVQGRSRSTGSSGQLKDKIAMQDTLCYVNYTALPIMNEPFPPFDSGLAANYRYRQQQSVNLGSWFVHEKWMTPSLFEHASGSKNAEIDIPSGWGSQSCARDVLEQHWDTFIKQSDFQYLTSIGINTVRLPIGYWNLPTQYSNDTPFSDVADVYRDSWPRVLRAISWAAAAGIGVLIDLHGAPGSQNGEQHSGVSDGTVSFFEPSNMEKTIRILTYLTKKLASINNVVGIQLLNEPHDSPSLPDFYDSAISEMRKSTLEASNFPIYVHDAFNLNQYSDFVADRTDFVVVDHHSYFVFTETDGHKPASQHTTDISTIVSNYLESAFQKPRRNLVVDEWSCALTAESLAAESDPEQASRDFCTKQMEVYANNTAGWSFWSYKTEDCDSSWCFTAAVGGILPGKFFSYEQLSHSDFTRNLTGMISDTVSPPERDSVRKWVQAQVSSEANEHSGTYSNAKHLRHRFEAIQKRKRLESAQHSAIVGYLDGFNTAKTFAEFNLSKLGYLGQFIQDYIARHGQDVISPGTEEYYESNFVAGLRDAEAAIGNLISTTSSSI